MCEVIAYNLTLWFKSALLPKEIKSCQAKTLQRKIVSVPGKIVNTGGGRKRVRLPPNQWLEGVVQVIKENLKLFFTALVERATTELI